MGEEIMKLKCSLGTVGMTMGIWLAASSFAYGETSGAMTIESGKNVKINLVLTVDGKEMLNTEGHEPIVYTVGQNQILPGLEKELNGLKVGDRKDVILNPQDGFGEIDPKAFVELPKSQFPEGKEIVKGATLDLVGPSGNRVPAVITEVKESTVMLDVNHPLAGKQLHFQAVVLEIT